MLHHDCNKKEEEKKPERRRAIRPGTVIRFHLNPWTLNDFPWVETACQRCVCDSVCVRVRERKKKGVCPRLHQQFKPFISSPQHPSVLHPVLFTPHLFPYISPPPSSHPTESPGRLFTLSGWCSNHLFLSVFCQSVSLLWLIWLVSWLAVNQSASWSLSQFVSLTGLPVSPFVSLSVRFLWMTLPVSFPMILKLKFLKNTSLIFPRQTVPCYI